MANFTFNIAKGRIAEYYWRVKNNDPANSALIVIVLADAGLESQAVLQDADTFTDVVAGATNEVTGSGWNRKTLTDVDLVAMPAPDDLGDLMTVATPQMTWTPDAAADDSESVVICYDSDTTGGTDANLVPLTHHDFRHVTDGNPAVIQAGGFFMAIGV